LNKYHHIFCGFLFANTEAKFSGLMSISEHMIVEDKPGLSCLLNPLDVESDLCISSSVFRWWNRILVVALYTLLGNVHDLETELDILCKKYSLQISFFDLKFSYAA